MKRVKLFLLLTGLIFLQSSLFATDFSCNFENGATDANMWTIVKVVQGGSWAITATAAGHVFSFDRGGGFGENLISAKNVTMTDGVASADIIMHDGIGGSATGILVRYVDADNFYMYRLHYSEGKVQLYRKVAGTFTKLNENVLVGGGMPNFDQVYNLKIKVVGQTFTCFLDNVMQFVVTDDNTTLTAGTIGFRVFDQSVSIDNVLITSVDAAAVHSVEDARISIFYNKSAQKIELRSEFAISDICVYSVSGRTICETFNNGFEQAISVSNWCNGVYIIRINTSEGEIIRKITKI